MTIYQKQSDHDLAVVDVRFLKSIIELASLGDAEYVKVVESHANGGMIHVSALNGTVIPRVVKDLCAEYGVCPICGRPLDKSDSPKCKHCTT